MSWSGLIKHYESYLPVTEKTPVLTLHEGNTPLVYFPHLSGQLGVELYGKVEGANPTGSFKDRGMVRSEEHTSELQSRGHLVCRLLLEKKNRSNKHMRQPG